MTNAAPAEETTTTMAADTARLAKMTNVELNNAFGEVARRHPNQWDHPRRVALRAEMCRRSGVTNHR